MSKQADKRRLIVALDGFDQPQAVNFCRRLDPAGCRVKVGKELFTRAGPAVLNDIHALGHEVFLDLKFHDIPATVAGACRAAADHGVWMINVHASGGQAMLAAARDALVPYADGAPILIAVTVLTSIDNDALQRLGVDGGTEQQVQRLAALTERAGLDGVVCSAREAALLAERFPKLISVTPGIRLADDAADDQIRITTPQRAVQNGSDYLVVGRSVTAASDPLQRVELINRQIAGLE